VTTPGRRAEALTRVEREIRHAQAAALGRVGERLERLLQRVAELDRDLDRERPGNADRDGTRLHARNRLRDEARDVRQHLIIQREALGMRSHATVDQRYPVPPRRTPEADRRGGQP
jgi:hypothetical protein